MLAIEQAYNQSGEGTTIQLIRLILMKNIKYAFAVFLLLLTGVWLLADSLLPEPLTYFSFRSVFIQYSGVIAMGVMSLAMILALRPQWLEPHLRGLDKMYRLHKWLGITALVVGTLHWWWARGTKWMVGWGWLDRPERGPRPEETLGAVEAALRSQRGVAESIGEWAFYGAVVLIVLALVKSIPYRLFAKTHRFIAPAYLLLAFHSVVLMEFDYWSRPVGWLMALLLLGGCVAAVYSITGRIGASRRVGGEIRSLTWYPNLKVLETSAVLDEQWPGHRAGQFAFVTADRHEGPHPFTIASSWDVETREIVFISKDLGDYTARLPDELEEGKTIHVEGPYGCFDFRDDRPHQVWVGAGIGITPFIARMKELATHPGAKPVDLFHVTADVDEQALSKLKADAAAAGVRLHLIISGRDGRLDAGKIREAVPQWSEASFWFCGPAPFGQQLRQALVAEGHSADHFHQELFQMR